MPQPAVLHVIGGNDRGKVYELVLPETRIGRGADQDLVLADIAVSRRHVTIHAEAGRYRLRDLGSGNGTLVNGVRADGVLLNDGDQIELGNTLMRFDHAASRPVQPGPSYTAGGRAPLAAPTMAPPPQFSAPIAAPQPSYSAAPAAAYTAPQPLSPPDTHSGNIMRPSVVMSTGGGALPGFLAPLAVPRHRLIAFGVMGGVSLLALVAIVARTALAKPPVVSSDAEDFYRQGLKLFLAKDYEGAKVSFADAAQAAPEVPEIRRYINACDVEVHARGAMQSAERAANGRRYTEAVKALDAVDSESILRDDATRRRKELAPKAAAEDVEEARVLQTEDPDTARARLEQALALDPGNGEARALATKMHLELPPLPAGAPAPVVTPLGETSPPAAKPEPKPDLMPPSRAVATPKAAPPSKKPRVAMAKEKEEAAPTRSEAAASPAALAAYRTRDFGNAERIVRTDARAQPAKLQEKTIAFANQVRDLKQAVDKAIADEPKNPQGAIKDYEDALAIDARIGHGMHAAYFRQRMGKLELPIAQQAFAQGRYDVAWSALQQAQKAGAGDGGLGRQLEGKAKELTDKGAAIQKTNPAQAKTYWRQVIKMVPPSSPSYVRAYQLINQGGGGHKDEDED